ncbi:ribosome silencing factor [Abyssicoccus albus]|uniref:Ribosomal silencing factor RsfS n=1 Tax=Abyssicoccus albus TaxID=1817405 RepID=A0A1Q1G120_9BACL|nr:ribosome silencing factor [Abyssicoccus albus]AQL56036.1 ribosome silencing factor [Abyssicoccus albus]RPF58160.1 ribosome-associated protein [Abyssicoccus albus]
MESKTLMEIAYNACDDKIAEDILVFDMKGKSPITDYFVICHGNSEKQVQAIARHVKEEIEKNGVEIKRLEGFTEANWILVDATDVVIHVFNKEERSYYNLERLFKEAPIVESETING